MNFNKGKIFRNLENRPVILNFKIILFLSTILYYKWSILFTLLLLDGRGGFQQLLERIAHVSFFLFFFIINLNYYINVYLYYIRIGIAEKERLINSLISLFL